MCGWAIGWERSVCWRPWGSPGRSRCCIGDGAREKRETRNAERGTGRLELDSGHDIPRTTCVRSVPHSALRIPQSGGEWGGGVVRVGVDVGGTFTDLVALTPDGTIEVRKVATTPEDPALGMFRALDTLGTRDEGRGTSAVTSPPVPRPSSPVPIDMLIHGTTIATNALLERRGARVVLVTTRGFEDLLWLRRQDRAALYDLARDHPPPLVVRDDVVGAAERMGPAGVLEPLTDREVARVVAAVRALAPEAVAIALLFAFRDPTHERRLAGALRDALPGAPVAASHEVLPLFREFERTSTTTVEAYLRPKVSTCLERLEGGVRERKIGALRVMTSSGGTRAPHGDRCLCGAGVARRGQPPGRRCSARPRSRGAGPAPVGSGGRRRRRTHRGGGGRRGRRRDGARLETRQRRARPRPPPHDALAVRRRGSAVRLPAGRSAGDGHDRHPAASRSTFRAGARSGGGAGRPTDVVSPGRR